MLQSQDFLCEYWKMEEKIPTSYKIGRQLDTEKIHFLNSRVNELIKSNKELRQSSGQTEKDTHDIVLYFQREMEIKDDVILRLNEELVKCQTQLKFEVEKVRKTFESELQVNCRYLVIIIKHYSILSK